MDYLREMSDSGYSDDNINDYEKFVYPHIVCRLCGVVEGTARILDAGAGSGHVLIPLLEAGFKNLYALDLKDTLKGVFVSRGIDFRTVDLEWGRLDYEDNFFDVVFCKNVIEHILNPETMLGEFRRVLKSGGKLVIISDDWEKTYKTFYRDPTHVRPYDKQSVQRLLRMHGFSVIHVGSFLAKCGVGRLKLYRIIPRLAFIGDFFIAIAGK